MDVLILAGGENKRLPVLKGFLEIRGRRIIESTIELLRTLFDRVIISTNTPESFFYLGVPIVGDVVKYRGPMAGILSAFISLEVPEIFVTACDMPFIKPALINYIVGQTKQYTAELPGMRRWGAVIPIFGNRPQPLLGIYSREIVPMMERSIQEDTRSLRRLFKKIDVLYIPEDEVKAVDPEGMSFVNINTPEDFEREGGGKNTDP